MVRLTSVLNLKTVSSAKPPLCTLNECWQGHVHQYDGGFYTEHYPKCSKWFGGLWLTQILNRPSEYLTGLLAKYMRSITAGGSVRRCTGLITAVRTSDVRLEQLFTGGCCVPVFWLHCRPEWSKVSLSVITSTRWVIWAVWLEDFNWNINCLVNETCGASANIKF